MVIGTSCWCIVSNKTCDAIYVSMLKLYAVWYVQLEQQQKGQLQLESINHTATFKWWIEFRHHFHKQRIALYAAAASSLEWKERSYFN